MPASRHCSSVQRAPRPALGEKAPAWVLAKAGSYLIEILRAFAKINSKRIFSPLKFVRESVFKIDEALKSIVGLVHRGKNWVLLQEIIPKEWKGSKVKVRSAMATTFAASLELVKSGDCILEQNSPFQSLRIKSKDREDNK